MTSTSKKDGADEPGLALIVGAARSGTTLTRLLLDAHPEVGCPSEAGLPALMDHLARVWATVHADELLSESPFDPGAKQPQDAPPARWEDPTTDGRESTSPDAPVSAPPRVAPAARRWIIDTVKGPMIDYCAPRGKRLYCDKSLDSVHHLEIVAELFPRVKMLLVFRHVMDTIASGIEASPWGFQAYGYGPYVQSVPGNFVAALGSYWLDHVSQALAFEKDHPDLCHRVLYEELVQSPEATVADFEHFLGVGHELSILRAAFRRKPPQGPGDFKVEHTTRVHADSVGHGKRVPITMLPPALLKAINEQLDALGYERLDRGWNAAERPVDGRGLGLWARRLKEIMSTIVIEPGGAPTSAESFAVIAEDHHALRWVINRSEGTIDQGDGQVDGVLTGTAEDLVLMLTSEENLGVLVRSNRIRHVVAEPPRNEAGREVADEVRQLVSLLRTSIGARQQQPTSAVRNTGTSLR